MRSRIWFCRVLVFILVISFPLFLYSQECEYVEDDKGRIDNILNVDGDKYLIIPVERAQKVLAVTKEYELQKEEIRLLESQKLAFSKMLDEQKFIIEFLERDRALNMDLLSKSLNPTSKWYENNWVIFGAAFVITGASYGYWSHTSR